jgi:hypothetical protein
MNWSFRRNKIREKGGLAAPLKSYQQNDFLAYTGDRDVYPENE